MSGVTPGSFSEWMKLCSVTFAPKNIMMSPKKSLVSWIVEVRGDLLVSEFNSMNFQGGDTLCIICSMFSYMFMSFISRNFAIPEQTFLKASCGNGIVSGQTFSKA